MQSQKNTVPMLTMITNFIVSTIRTTTSNGRGPKTALEAPPREATIVRI